MDHFHLHCLVLGGALSKDGQEWINCGNDFLFPVKALSKVYRGEFIAYLEDAFQKGLLKFPGNTRSFGTKEGFRRLIRLLWSKAWVVSIPKSQLTGRSGSLTIWPLHPSHCNIQSPNMRVFKWDCNVHGIKQKTEYDRKDNPRSS